MRFKTVLKVLGVLLCIFSSTLIPPVLISLFARDGALDAFVYAFIVTLGAGLALWLPLRGVNRELRFRDGFLIVVLLWSVLAVFGAIPLFLVSSEHISITDAFFESMSGLTTTGATIMLGIDELPVSIRYYRQQLQWLGGMGIIVLAVAVLPMLGVGGMQLFRAETPGPIKDAKLTPRITETAKALWYIYLGLTVICALAYWVVGMSLFDAIGHSFSTVAIGGFSTHDLSLGFFDSHAVNTIAMIFMLISGVNFALHFVALRSRKPGIYLKDNEVSVYLIILGVAAMLTIATLLLNASFVSKWDSVMHGLFQVISVATTTGFTTSGFAGWPVHLPIMIILLSAVGGCAGSTAGGMKVIRAVLLFKQGKREISRLVHPSALIPIKLNGKPVPDSVVDAVWGFFALYVLCYLFFSLLLMATGADPVTAFSAVTACLNNLGPGLGEVAENYASISTAAKWILSLCMLLGRLELFTLLVLLSPAFWRS